MGMTNNIKIYKFKKVGEKFEEVGFDLYTVTYLRGKKAHLLRVVVNGAITKFHLNIVNVHQGYKSVLLEAISEYKQGKVNTKVGNITNRKVVREDIRKLHSRVLINRFCRHLQGISSIKTRDTLTKYNLI